MNNKQTVAAVAYSGETTFRLENVNIELPRPDEILVEIKGVGICHTDLIFRSGNVPYPFPAVFGHEGSGVVEAVGDKVTKVKPGDHVLITFRSCGACNLCDHGDPAYCHNMWSLNVTGGRVDGTSSISNENGSIASNFFGQSSFAAHALSYERNLVKVDKSLPIELLGPLGCGVQTGVGSVLRSLNTRKGSNILIAGGGSVGLSAVMGAAIQQCENIIVLEPMESRRELAKEFGATHCIDSKSVENVTELVREIVPLGVDNALDTTAITPIQQICFDSLGSKGTLGLVGIGEREAALPGNMGDMIGHGKTIKAIIEGDSNPDEFLPELVEYYKSGQLPIERMITTYNLNDINTAIEDQHSGKCVKAVLIPDAV